MPYPKCKIYSDRSHYIAIPHTERPYKPRKKPKEEAVVPPKEFLQKEQEGYDEEEQTYQEEVLEGLTDDKETFMGNSVIGTGITRRELFENLYRVREKRNQTVYHGGNINQFRLSLGIAEEIRDTVCEIYEALALAFDKGDLIKVFAVPELTLEKRDLNCYRAERVLYLMSQSTCGLTEIHKVALLSHLILIITILLHKLHYEKIKQDYSDQHKECNEIYRLLPVHVMRTVKSHVHYQGTI